MIEPELIEQKDLGTIFSMSKKKARELCAFHGVYPINVGLGKVSRLRWYRSEVMDLLGALRAKGEPKEYVSRKKSSKVVLGKSVNDLLREFSTPMQ